MRLSVSNRTSSPSLIPSNLPLRVWIDGLPAWFIRLLAPICSSWIARLFNQTLNSSTIPDQWRVARIRPVAKTKTPVGPGDFRPISVVPVLSRILERIVVNCYIYPAFDHLPFRLRIQDQFAFRPTGSTSAALIDLLQKVTKMLLDNEYVVITSVDFTKAFDRVRHHALSIKYIQLDLPDHIHN